VQEKVTVVASQEWANLAIRNQAGAEAETEENKLKGCER